MNIWGSMEINYAFGASFFNFETSVYVSGYAQMNDWSAVTEDISDLGTSVVSKGSLRGSKPAAGGTFSAGISLPSWSVVSECPQASGNYFPAPIIGSYDVDSTWYGLNRTAAATQVTCSCVQ